MYTTLLADATLFEALLEIDQELAVTAQARGCLICGGRLDHADYPREPRGGPSGLRSEYDRRTSFCCADSRKRLTPMSVRFLGRKVYLGVVVLLACVLRQGPTRWRVARLREVLGVSTDTLRRWHHWWRDAFVRTPFWTSACARFARPIGEDDQPSSLLQFLPRNRTLLRRAAQSAQSLGRGQGAPRHVARPHRSRLVSSRAPRR